MPANVVWFPSEFRLVKCVVVSLFVFLLCVVCLLVISCLFACFALFFNLFCFICLLTRYWFTCYAWFGYLCVIYLLMWYLFTYFSSCLSYLYSDWSLVNIGSCYYLWCWLCYYYYHGCCCLCCCLYFCCFVISITVVMIFSCFRLHWCCYFLWLFMLLSCTDSDVVVLDCDCLCCLLFWYRCCYYLWPWLLMLLSFTDIDVLVLVIVIAYVAFLYRYQCCY